MSPEQDTFTRAPLMCTTTHQLSHKLTLSFIFLNCSQVLCSCDSVETVKDASENETNYHFRSVQQQVTLIHKYQTQADKASKNREKEPK